MPSRARWTEEEKREVWKYIYERVKDGSVLYEAPTGLKFWQTYVNSTGSTRQVNTLNKYYRIHLRENIASSELSADQIDEIIAALPITLSPMNTVRLDNRRQAEDLLKLEPKDEVQSPKVAMKEVSPGRRSNRLKSVERKSYRDGRTYNKDRSGRESTNSGESSPAMPKKMGRPRKSETGKPSASGSSKPSKSGASSSKPTASSPKPVQSPAIDAPSSSSNKALVSPVDESGFINTPDPSQCHTPKQRRTPRISLNRSSANSSQSSYTSNLSRHLASPHFLDLDDGADDSSSVHSTPKRTPNRKRRAVLSEESSSQESVAPPAKRQKENTTPPENNNHVAEVAHVESDSRSNSVVDVEPAPVLLQCKEEPSEVQESSDEATFALIPPANLPPNVVVASAAPAIEAEVAVNGVANGTNAPIDEPVLPSMKDAATSPHISIFIPPGTPNNSNNSQLTPKSILTSKLRKVNRASTPTRVTFGACPTLDRPKGSTPLSTRSPAIPTATVDKYNPMYYKCTEVIWNSIQESRPENTRRPMTQEDFDKVKNLALTKECFFKLRQVSSFITSMFPPVVQPTKVLQETVDDEDCVEKRENQVKDSPKTVQEAEKSEDPAKEIQEPISDSPTESQILMNSQW
uniref:SANT domain-containing protein n=1 Tax=Panagrellus redivivus TaxID=6233 RepID=A0A7E4VR77_PANRE